MKKSFNSTNMNLACGKHNKEAFGDAELHGHYALRVCWHGDNRNVVFPGKSKAFFLPMFYLERPCAI